MLSASFLAWAAAGGAIFGLTSLAAGRHVSAAAIMAILGAILGWLCAVFAMPSFDPWLAGSVLLFFVLFGIAAVLSMMSHNSPGPFLSWLGLAFLTVLVAFFSSFPGFHAERYANLLVPAQAARDTSIPLIDQSQARLVTDELARKRAAELLSSIDEKGIGTRVVVGEMWGNEVGGTMWWIAPLEHTGFFRWLNFGTTPGYIMVSQSNEVDAKVVLDRPIRIGKEAWFSDNVYRRLYMAGYIDYDYADAMFQVDDGGQPYWVVPLLYPQVGFGGYMPVKWALVDAADGSVETFDSPEEMPDWIDRIYPQDVIADRFDDWGCLSNGWVACAFTGQNVIRSTPGINVAIDANGEIIYYSGTEFANSKAEGASSGLYVANARTGRTVFYPRAGITEVTAKRTMEQAYANYPGYTAAEPILLSINGQEAFFSVILDASGVRKGFAVIAQDNRNIIGTGNSVQAAVTEFNRALQRSSRDSAFEAGTAGAEEVEGLVVTYQPYVQNGKTVFYVTIDTLPGKILEVSEEKIGEIVATLPGDPVRISSDNFRPGVVYVTSFDNLRIELKEEGLQPVVDKRAGDAMDRYKDQKARRDAEALVKELSPEQVDRLLEALRKENADAPSTAD